MAPWENSSTTACCALVSMGSGCQDTIKHARISSEDTLVWQEMERMLGKNWESISSLCKLNPSEEKRERSLCESIRGCHAVFKVCQGLGGIFGSKSAVRKGPMFPRSLAA